MLVAVSGRGCDVILFDDGNDVGLVEAFGVAVDWSGVTVVVLGQYVWHFESLTITFCKEFLKTEAHLFSCWR